MNIVKEIERITNLELEAGIYGGKKGSWHEKYKNSAWAYIGGLSYDLSEGDVIAVMSQWGEIEDINLVRDSDTGKSKGFAFIKYEDQRSTILAVDNFNGTIILGRTIRCDHVDQYRLPKEVRDREEKILEDNPEADVKIGPGHAYQEKELENQFDLAHGQDIWGNPSKSEDEDVKHKNKKSKSEKKEKKAKHKHHKSSKDKRTEVNAEKSIDVKADLQVDLSTRYSARGSYLEPEGSRGAAPMVSWRGKRDPEAAVEAEAQRKKLANADNPLPKRDEFDGFGGMKRRR